MKGLIALASGAICLAGVAIAQEQTLVSIGTGGVTGVYYPTGGGICRLVNRERKTHNVRCRADSTGGSVYNIESLRSGDLQFGIAQSDWQFHAVKGTSRFEGNAFADLRAVFSLHPEPFTVIVRADSGIEAFADLKGKRVNVGNPGSGQRGTMEVVMDAYGWSMDDFAEAAELKGSEMAKQLCGDSVDAVVYTIGHPAAAIKEAAATCDVRLVGVAGPEIDRLLADQPYYRVTTIPAGTYKGTDSDITTFGVDTTLVTSASIPDHVVHVITKTVMDNIREFRTLHPALADLDPEAMMTVGLTAPLHPGAEQAYRDLGMK